MPRLSQRPFGRTSRYLLVFVALVFLARPASAVNHGSGHVHHHTNRSSRTFESLDLSVTTAVASGPSGTLSALEDSQRMVKNAHEALSIVNKGRLAYPQGNTYELQHGGAADKFRAAPLLEHKDIDSFRASVATVSLNDTKPTIEDPHRFSYTISSKLAEAARIVAESSPQPLPIHNDADLAQIIWKYRTKQNDTNTPPQTYVSPNGLGGGMLFDAKVPEESEKSELRKRGSEDFWLTEMSDSGSSPFAPEGYKVWRNVKDYGAKGDGITDDTTAINKAVSDGGRCGANCGSSTIYPAVVYFPPGTYLISSSIIQYYNTEFYGNPFDYPTILAASSFVGLGVISSDVYTGESSEWYLNTNNFLRSIRNFKMDITRTDPNAYVCAIHWQVAQGTSLENIIFYMMENNATTQQGIYMENGSGGFLTNLTFVGGNFGAYFGNQQFTTTQLTFHNCDTALQIHWDWAWTMQDVLINNCNRGIVIVGGAANGPGSTGQSVGSFIVSDVVIIHASIGILTSLFSENSTSFLLQNAMFMDVSTAIHDNIQDRALLDGDLVVIVDSWGFGLVTTSSADVNSTFVNGEHIPMMNRSSSLTGPGTYAVPKFFQRRRPTYTDIGRSQVINVKSWGAAGDGKTDDTTILNFVLHSAANMSSIVFFPFGVYIVKDTLRVPLGSRIVGQAWSQIMGTGPRFEDEHSPRAVVQVGNPGDVGIIEVQSMMVTVSGPAAGAVLMEWNVHESTQGSAGLWDTHFRVGGAIGSELQVKECPKNDGFRPKCKAASLLLHLTPKSSAYLENSWIWTADHDLDSDNEDQINVFAGRGVLVESQGPTWLYGTASEHNVLYQYQLSGVKDIYLGMIQTESPYFQPVPAAPAPFDPGLFTNDPDFSQCPLTAEICRMSWAIRILNSTTVYSMGSGLYSWFSNYSQECLNSEDCQARGVQIAQSYDTWLYNVVVKGMAEMVSPVNSEPTLSTNNMNGFMASILAWVRDPDEVIGSYPFPGFQIHSAKNLDGMTDTCKRALTQKIMCAPILKKFQEPGVGIFIKNSTVADQFCDPVCAASLKSWFDNVSSNCADQTLGASDPTRFGGYIYANYNLTCMQDPSTGEYCMPFVNSLPVDDGFTTIPIRFMCSYCLTTRLIMIMSSAYTAKPPYVSDLEWIHYSCGMELPAEEPPSLVIDPPSPPPFCISGQNYTIQKGDTCDTIAREYHVASAALQSGNPTLINNCSDLIDGRDLCLPLRCGTVYTLKDNDTCFSIEREHKNLALGSVRTFNPWINYDCSNLQDTREIVGSVICLSPQGGTHNSSYMFLDGGVKPLTSTGYTDTVMIPPSDANIAKGTTKYCGSWHKVADGETCASICMREGIPHNLFVTVNPSLQPESSEKADCDSLLSSGVTYCVGPDTHWNDTGFWGNDSYFFGDYLSLFD